MTDVRRLPRHEAAARFLDFHAEQEEERADWAMNSSVASSALLNAAAYRAAAAALRRIR